MTREKTTLGGVAIGNPDKLWFPDDGITKLDVARFYADVSARVVPWTAARPLIAERCPDGMLGSCFFQKDFTRGLPAHVPRATIAARSVGRSVRYVVGGSKQTLLELCNLGCIAVHVMSCRVGSLDDADWLAFDLDPSSGAFADAARAGRVLHRVLDELGLRAYPKTSGGRGLHVFVPLAAGQRFDDVRAFARAVAAVMVERQPELATLTFAKRERGDRVFVDTLRNSFGHTIVTPYSVRRRPKAPVSAPLHWDEVEPRLDPSRFNLRTIARRLGAPDPWASFWRHRQHLPELPAPERRPRAAHAR